jgi:phosphatidate cytidylyltransferase
VLLRIVSAVVLIPLVLAAVLFARPPYFIAALTLVGILALREYFGLAVKMGLGAQPWFGYAAFVLLLAGLYSRPFPPLLVLAIVLLAAYLAAMWSRAPMRERASGMMATLFGVLYLALCLFPAQRIRFDFGERLGAAWLVVLLAATWVGDTAALAAGRTFGRSLFAPQLSPKKTNEGAVAGLAGSVLGAVAVQHFAYPELPITHVALASLLAGMAGQLGDLAESMLKRAAETKDSSSLIPGHGGVLDRIDSLLFAIPALYLYLVYLYG